MKKLIAKLDMNVAESVYKDRKKLSDRMLETLTFNKKKEFTELALGQINPVSNYSASEPSHNLGVKVLTENTDAEDKVFRLGQKLLILDRAADILPTIKNENIKYLGVSIGSEIIAMLKPKEAWVVNRRTLWFHLFDKHGDLNKANLELSSFNQGIDSEMNYEYWKYYFLAIEGSLKKILEINNKHDNYLWADVIASMLYEEN